MSSRDYLEPVPTVGEVKRIGFLFHMKLPFVEEQVFMYLFPVFLSSQYFETDDPEFYKSKVCFILNNDMSEMELVFAEEKYNKSGQLDKVRGRTKA